MFDEEKDDFLRLTHNQPSYSITVERHSKASQKKAPVLGDTGAGDLSGERLAKVNVSRC